jgi:hypothetical protein
VSNSFVSMIENGTRQMTRYTQVAALAGVLGVSPAELVPGFPLHAVPGPGIPATAPFPAAPDPVTLARHGRLAQELAACLARNDRLAAEQWLHRAARDPQVNPWLLLIQMTGPGERRGMHVAGA